MSTTQKFVCFALAASIRLLLIYSEYQKIIADRVEVSTALNSWKKVTEGVYLREAGIDPYTGDLFHESPIGLVVFSYMQKYLSSCILCGIFVFTDLATAWILGLTAYRYTTQLIATEQKDIQERKKQSNDTEVSALSSSMSIPASSVTSSALLVPSAYLFNPYVVFNCVGLTTTVFTNFLLSVALHSMINKSRLCSCFTIAVLTLQGLYPITLMVPATIYLARNEEGKSKNIPYGSIIKTIAMFISILTTLYYLSYKVSGSWSFLHSTIGFILTVPDLRPNIGLYWYFFTEMFEHFRWLFVASFQINVGLLYVAPLALRFRRDPMLLAFSYLAIAAIFKSYPCLGEVGFYMALLPMWKHLFPHMQQGFIVSCFLLSCTVFAPTVWHLWIYSRSANANFYFGVTLAFAIAQIFLVTDVLFASVKREFSLRHGLSREIHGNTGKLLLE
ncbi:phosphatidylinositol glycan anchor biosynthesis class U protein [Diprion similis]|uniref:phosphatidylinositol glycan anchor biosynthesis class U protein n=1 Tax=Diprion similis TaxID=362088 RepID=UPI001EF7F91B|nr:phosphatidylinositol glycan anchor biosynthesis class U protein [Diprion similis]